MPYRKEKFENGDIVHVILRGIDGNIIFRDKDDYFRGIFSIYELNNLKPTEVRVRRRIRIQFKKTNNCGGRTSATFADKRERMVDILCFCFMPNHIHLLLKQVKDNGITEFMRKIGTGYGGYINRKYKRQGHVFQSSFNAVKITTDEQLRIVVAYIHTNSLSLNYPKWKEIGIENPQEALDFLKESKESKWSSHLDYMGIKNFPSVTQREFILDLFGNLKKYQEFIEDYIFWKGNPKE